MATTREYKGILKGVDALIDEWLGITAKGKAGERPRHSTKRAAKKLSANGGPMREAVGTNLLQQILKRIDENWKSQGKREPSSETWSLGKALRLSPENESDEVVLERLIVRLLGVEWTNQVATCSGLIPKANEGRRSIDLVRDCGDKRYEFIELKFKNGYAGDHGSNTPLDAAWEIIEYGMLYLHARHNRLGKKSPLMTAKTIHLVVLAPEAWYSYDEKNGYKFEWLETTVNGWLEMLLTNTSLRMDFQFQKFTKAFDDIYKKPSALPNAVQAFRRANLSHRVSVYRPEA